jgi:hypothetical protein
MKSLRTKIEDMLAAISFAEEGEFAAATEFSRPERRVVLALTEAGIDEGTLQYALNSTKRTAARLDILYGSAPDGRASGEVPLFSRFLAALQRQGTPYRVISVSGCLKEAILDYTNRERNIAFAVVESPGSLDAGCTSKDGRLSELWRNLSCPLVVVMDAAKS